MTIEDIYKKVHVPPYLQEHMLRVCGIVAFIEKHWTGQEEVDWDFTKKIALLHDVGNIVKFDLDKYPEFSGTEQANMDYWKDIQKEIRDTYGTDEHAATEKILKEAGAEQALIDTILAKSFGNSIAVQKSKDWELKLLYYGDFRTLPLGIGTLEERISDIRSRMPHYTSRPDFEDLVEACKAVEAEVQKNINVPVSQITEGSVVSNPVFLKLELIR